MTGYRITWRSVDGWVEQIGAKDLSEGLRLKALRKIWMSDPRSEALAVQEWRASMENRPPFLEDGRERQPAALSTRDMERIIDEAFHVALQLKSADDCILSNWCFGLGVVHKSWTALSLFLIMP